MTPKRKRMGRPMKPAAPGKRVSLGLKVTADIKSRLDEAARGNDWTQSREAEARLERSFRDEDAVERSLGGTGVADIAQTVARSMKLAGESAFMLATGSAPKPGAWLHHPWAFDQAFKAATHALERLNEELRPAGKVVPPKAGALQVLLAEDDPERENQIRQQLFATLGERYADAVLSERKAEADD